MPFEDLTSLWIVTEEWSVVNLAFLEATLEKGGKIKTHQSAKS